MSNKRFTKDFLNKLCKEYNINLLHNYNEADLNYKTIIEFNCTICNNNTSKQFINIEKYNSFCKECSYYLTKNKIKYDLTYLNKICNKKSITLTKDYSNERLNSLSQIEFNCIKCNLTTNKRFQYITLYDALCHNCSCNEKGNKARETTLEKYGVKNISQLDEIKNKKIKTTLKNYGVEHPLQNEQLMNKSIDTSYSSKIFIFPSGKKIKCQGYEPFALNEIKQFINENEIITGCKNVPIIWYIDGEGKKRKHYVDIFIPSKNKCIEVKSTWTIKHKNSYIFEKQNAAKELGYEYEIWVYDKNGNKVEIIT